MLKKISRSAVNFGIRILLRYPALYRPLRDPLRSSFPELYSKLFIFLTDGHKIPLRVPSLGERARRIHIALNRALSASKKK